MRRVQRATTTVIVSVLIVSALPSCDVLSNKDTAGTPKVYERVLRYHRTLDGSIREGRFQFKVDTLRFPSGGLGVWYVRVPYDFFLRTDWVAVLDELFAQGQDTEAVRARADALFTEFGHAPLSHPISLGDGTFAVTVLIQPRVPGALGSYPLMNLKGETPLLHILDAYGDVFDVVYPITTKHSAEPGT